MSSSFLDHLAKRILLTDGSYGVLLQKRGLEEADFRGERFKDHPKDVKNNPDLLNLTRPDVVAETHRAYTDAGAELIETNTFTATTVSQEDYGLENFADEMSLEGARICRRVVDEAIAKDGRPRWVAGSIGPLNRSASVVVDADRPAYRNISWEGLRETYYRQVKNLIEGGVDVLILRNHVRYAEPQGRALRDSRVLRRRRPSRSRSWRRSSSIWRAATSPVKT